MREKINKIIIILKEVQCLKIKMNMNGIGTRMKIRMRYI
jgi:hypothetical protein